MYASGAVTVPEFSEFVNGLQLCESEKVKFAQGFIPCAYFMNRTPGERPCLVGYMGPGVTNPLTLPIDCMALTVTRTSKALIDISELVGQLDLSQSGDYTGPVHTYSPTWCEELSASQQVSNDFGLYKTALFDEYAALIRKIHPDYSDLDVARYQMRIDGDGYGEVYHPDFTETRKKDTEVGLLESWTDVETVYTKTGECRMSCQLFHTDFIKPANRPIFEKIIRALIAAT